MPPQDGGFPVSIAVVDAAGDLLAFARLDRAMPHSVTIAQGKAATAARFKKPTGALESMVAQGRTAFVAVDGVTPLQGGVPIMVGAACVGTVGVSGVAAADDEKCALAGVAALAL
jgi:glc operon protein GlcG